MAVAFQVTFDCADPRRMAKFWAQALGYKEQDPPEGWDSWEAWAADQGIPREQFDSMSAVVDPAGHGPTATLSARARAEVGQEPSTPRPECRGSPRRSGVVEGQSCRKL
jgi:hypothetical protein